MNSDTILHAGFVASAFVGIIASNMKLHHEYEQSIEKPSIPERMAWGYVYSIGGVYCGIFGLIYSPIFIPTYLAYKLLNSVVNKENDEKK